MSTARMVTQLTGKMPAGVGALAKVASAVHAAGVNITAICAYEEEGEGSFMMVTSDDAAAADALRGLGAEVTEESAVVVDMPDRPGALEHDAGRIAAAGINIDYVYGSAGAETATIVFKSADPAAMAAAING